jgi:hypothetical protein
MLQHVAINVKLLEGVKNNSVLFVDSCYNVCWIVYLFSQQDPYKATDKPLVS